MKVTQVIKEAITTRVMAKCEEANKGYQLALNTELARLDEERKQRLNDLTKEYQKAFFDMLKKMDDKKISYSYTLYSNKEITDKDYIWEKNKPGLYLTVTSDYAKDLKAKIQENQDKAKKFINDIILELELGESKPTLESLLANIKF